MLLALTVLLALSGAAQAQEQPPASKSVTVALAQEPEGLFNPSSPSGRLAASLVFDPLIGLDDHMQPYPVLAAQIPSTDNDLVQMTGSGPARHLVVTMPLRDGVTWSDGEPFTADDVVYTWQLLSNQESGFDTRVEDKLKSVDKLDDLTVRFTYQSASEAGTADPPSDPLAFFGLYDAPAIYPRHVLRQIVGDDPRHNPDVATLATSSFARNPVGTGPYTLTSWDPGNTLSFASRALALPQRLGRPAIDRLTLRVMPDKNASLTALQSGDLQVVSQGSLDASDAPVLDTLPGSQAFYTPGPALEQLTFNFDNPPLGDVNVRRAIAQAIDRQALNDAALFGKAQVPPTLVPSWSWAAATSDVPTYAYSQSEANQKLDQAGWSRGPDGVRQKNGQRLSLTLVTSPAAFRTALTGALRDQLAKVGIDVKVDMQPSSVVFDSRPNTPEALVARKFNLAEFAWVSSYDPGADQVYTLASSSVPTRANAYQGGNYGNYHSQGSDDLLDQVQRSLDPSFRHAALGQAQAIWQTDLPSVPLLVRPVVTAARQGLTNYKPGPTSETWNVEQWDLSTP